MFKQFTLGIEEEFQIVDPHTRELRSHVSEILEEGRMLLGEQVKPEMIQSMIRCVSTWSSPIDFGLRHSLGVTCYFAGRLLGRGFLLMFFLLV